MTLTLWVDGGSSLSSNLSGFIRDLTREGWINFSEKGRDEKKKEGKKTVRWKRTGVRAYPASSKTLTIIAYHSGKEERKRNNPLYGSIISPDSPKSTISPYIDIYIYIYIIQALTGLSPFIFPYGFRLDTEVYIKFLEKVVLALIERVPAGRPYVKQQDCGMSHKLENPVLAVRKFCHFITPNIWLPNSPDCISFYVCVAQFSAGPTKLCATQKMN